MTDRVCLSCHHRAHLGLCTARSGGTAYACACSTQTPPVSGPIDEKLRKAARRSYGTTCSLVHCKAGGGLSGGERDLFLPADLNVERDEAMEGTWISARIWIPDEDVEKDNV